MSGTENKIRRDTTANLTAYGALAQGEIGMDVTRNALVLGDGATAGGLAVTPFAGTWTPQLEFGGGSVGMTASVATGWYQVQGEWLVATCAITLTAKGSSTGAATITGLPFPAVFAGPATQTYHTNMNTSYVPEHYVGTGASVVTLAKGDDASSATLADTDFTNTSSLWLSIRYQIAQPTG